MSQKLPDVPPPEGSRPPPPPAPPQKKSRIEQENEGAREADDFFCPSCGARGFRYTCWTCASDMGAA